ncbi:MULTISPECIES: DNA repair protein RadC [Carboxydocella]|uniref:DNA repair protein RadC n=2 Tax=Carboxydocella TaxID=178898 RepID=A0A1T4S0T7_9FIRM|nr:MULTISPECIES: DNA repair protein RadC [Carboxydocella]AVX21137.1 DNA replication and repair protein RadC [Carboxydocella thermautotrophica]AVX31572.1 DNA replication and repair protein RadC [Carboxydocella thermautotrophica]SKA21899.1 DNA repair protein RadC [Carboxydocella sporoproducens DSM 16521]GAW27787.1 hypothetical protein ULO1_03570 [Carboxydocella sp. ULO1]GAW30299.1 hypothetical protein JDF658_00640 [Carboxydocella sp. JDF658]
MKNLSMRHLPPEQRPRERLLQQGPRVLSDAELLAILLRTGVEGESALQLAHRLLAEAGGIKNLAKKTVEDILHLPGIGPAKGALICAAFELGRRVATAPSSRLPVISGPEDAADLVMAEMAALEKEHFRVILLDVRNRVLGIDELSIGGMTRALADPRALFKQALRKNAVALILVHNHPSGDPRPSTEDIHLTRQLMQAGRLLDIVILDHIIIGDNKYCSLKEEGLLGS